MWDDQFNILGRQFRVVRYDQRGFGKSTAPQEAYSPVGDLLQLLDYLKIEQAHLVGNSMGGGLALDFALKHPARVASLCIVASGPNGYPAPQKDVESVIAVFRAAEKEGLARAVEMWLAHPMVGVASKTPQVSQRLRAMVSENSGMFRMKYWPSEPMKPAAMQLLKEVRVPTLVIFGDRDTQLVQAAATAAAEGIPGAKRVVIRGADHLPQMVKAKEFNRVLLDFLDSL
jgi:pimeloyl-ACP methyl ester carboxylesterase